MKKQENDITIKQEPYTFRSCPDLDSRKCEKNE